MDFDLFPDAELVMTTIYAAADWSPLAVPHIGKRVPANADFVGGILTVRRTGGAPIERHRLDHPNIQVDLWATDEKLVTDLTRRALQIASAAEGQTYNLPDETEVFVSAVDITVGPAYLFDSVSMIPRFTFTLALTEHSLP